MSNIFQKLAALPKLLVDLGILQADVAEIQTDPDLKSELDRSPLLKARLEQVSAEWRAVSQDIDKIRK